MTIANKLDDIEGVTKDIRSSIKLSKSDIKSNENNIYSKERKRFSQNIIINSSDWKSDNALSNIPYHQFNQENSEFNQAYEKSNNLNNIQKVPEIDSNNLQGDIQSENQELPPYPALPITKKESLEKIDDKNNQIIQKDKDENDKNVNLVQKENKLYSHEVKNNNSIIGENQEYKNPDHKDSNLLHDNEEEVEVPIPHTESNKLEKYNEVAKENVIIDNEMDQNKQAKEINRNKKTSPKRRLKRNSKQNKEIKQNKLNELDKDEDPLKEYEESVDQSRDRVMIYDQDEQPNAIESKKNAKNNLIENQSEDGDNVNVIEVTYSEEESQPPDEQSVNEQPDIEDEIEEVDEDDLEESQIPQYAFKSNRKKRESEDQFEREINQFDNVLESNKMKNKGFFKKMNKEGMNLISNKKNSKNINQYNESFDNTDFQEEVSKEPPQVEQNIDIIEDIDQTKIVEIKENNMNKEVNQQKEKKKKKVKDKTEYDNMKSQFEEKERSKLDQIEQKLKQLNKLMKKDKPKANKIEKKSNLTNFDNHSKVKIHHENNKNEEYQNELLRSKGNNHIIEKNNEPQDNDIEDLFGMKADISKIQNPKSKLDTVQYKAHNKIDFKADLPSLAHHKFANKQPLVLNKVDNDLDFDDLDDINYNNKKSILKSNRKFEEQNEEQNVITKQDQLSQNTLSSRFGLGFGGLNRGGLSKVQGIDNSILKYQRNKDSGIISPISRIPNTIFDAQLNQRDRSLPPQRNDKIFCEKPEEGILPLNSSNLISDMRSKYSQLSKGGLGANIAPPKRINLSDQMNPTQKSKITPSPRENESKYEDTTKNEMFRPLPSIGLIQNKMADSSIPIEDRFQSKQTNNFKFSSKFGEQTSFLEREAPKKTVFEFSKLIEPKPVKYNKSAQDEDDLNDMIDDLYSKPPQKKQDAFKFHEFNKILSKEKEPDKKKNDLFDSFDFD